MHLASRKVAHKAKQIELDLLKHKDYVFVPYNHKLKGLLDSKFPDT
jgi:hypothetical protein